MFPISFEVEKRQFCGLTTYLDHFGSFSLRIGLFDSFKEAIAARDYLLFYLIVTRYTFYYNFLKGPP